MGLERQVTDEPNPPLDDAYSGLYLLVALALAIAALVCM